MSARSTPTRFVAIVPQYGSAYYLVGEALMQVPLYADGYAHIASPDGPQPDGDIAEVEWDMAFETPAEAEPLRQLQRTLRCLPEDGTAPHSDPVLVSRADVSALLAAVGSARVRAADAYFTESRNFRSAGETAAGDEQEHAGILMGRSGEQLIEAAGAISRSSDPLADLAEVMPKVRWRDTDTERP